MHSRWIVFRALPTPLLLRRRRESDAGGNFKFRQCKKRKKEKKGNVQYVEDGNKNPWVIIPLLSPSYGFTILWCAVSLFDFGNSRRLITPTLIRPSTIVSLKKPNGHYAFLFSSVTKGVREWARFSCTHSCVRTAQKDVGRRRQRRKNNSFFPPPPPTFMPRKDTPAAVFSLVSDNRCVVCKKSPNMDLWALVGYVGAF